MIFFLNVENMKLIVSRARLASLFNTCKSTAAVEFTNHVLSSLFSVFQHSIIITQNLHLHYAG